MSPLLHLLVVHLVLVVHVAQASTVANAYKDIATCTVASSTLTGQCVPYDGICKGIVGNRVFLPDDGTTVQERDDTVVEQISSARAQGSVLSPECVHTGDWFICSAIWAGCKNGTNDPTAAVPLLPCVNVCDKFWTDCRDGFQSFLSQIIEKEGLPINASTIPNCLNGGTFLPPDNQPADVFGGRPILGYPDSVVGLDGQLRFPDGCVPARTCYFRTPS
jgi:hypothetical protein